MKNLYFVDDRISNKELINGCFATSSINGSMSWESLFLKKPTIIFGNIWYQNFPYVYKVSDNKDCVKILNKIKKIKNFELKKIYKSLEILYSNTNDLIYNKFSNKILNKKELDFIAKAFYDYYKEETKN